MIVAICTAILVLGILDYLTTRKILKNGGVELNPVMKWCIEKNLFIPVKAMFTLFVAGLIYSFGKNNHVVAIAGLVIVAGYVWIVWHNWRQLP